VTARTWTEDGFGLIQLAQDQAGGRHVDARPRDLRDRLTAEGQGYQVT
jgi:hypothetical protein